MNYAAVSVGPILILGIIMYRHVQNNIDDIKKNWVQYRCHPGYMPFASMVNPDVSTADNFGYCTNLFAKSVLDYATVPIYQLFDMFTKVITSIMGDLNNFRGYLAGMDKFIFSFGNTLFGKIQNTFSILLAQLGSVRDLMSRVTSSAYYAVFIISTMVSFLFSTFGLIMTTLKVVVGIIFAIAIILSFIFPILLIFFIPIGAMIGITWCFHPDTIIGGKAIKDLHIGDTIPGGKVSSLFYFTCPESLDLYRYNDIIVSGRHLVNHHGVWMYIQDTGCPLYTGERPPYIVCLNTTTNKVIVGDTLFADYEETSNPDALSEIETIVWGKQVGQTGIPGLHPKSKVRLASGETVPLGEIRLGTQLKEGRVIGIVVSDASTIDWVTIGTSIVSASQPVYTDTMVLASTLGVSSSSTPSLSIQIFLEGSDRFMIDDTLLVRDYPDSHDPTVMEDIQKVVLRYI